MTGTEFKRLRKRMGWTIVPVLAYRMGVTVRTVYRWQIRPEIPNNGHRWNLEPASDRRRMKSSHSLDSSSEV